VGDDAQPSKLASFPQSVQLNDDEVVVCSGFFTNRAKTVRVNAKVMEMQG